MQSKRTPIEERIVFHALKLGQNPVINLNVDGNDWRICVQLVVFKTDEKGITYHLSNVVLDPPVTNMINRLLHMFPDIKLTEKKLVALIKDSIVKGIYEERKRGEAVIFLTLDSWMRLEPKTDKSQLITTTPSKYRRLAKEEYKL